MKVKKTKKSEEMVKNCLSVYGLQGDDLVYHINQSGGDTEKALIAWAEDIIFGAHQVLDLVTRFKNKPMTVEANESFVFVSGDSQVVTEAVKDGLLFEDKFVVCEGCGGIHPAGTEEGDGAETHETKKGSYPLH